MRLDARIAAVVFGCGLLTPAARADLVTYTFLGTDTVSGASVTGSLSYSTDAALTSALPGRSYFADVKGSLSITLAGHTYSSDFVHAFLSPHDLLLTTYGSPGNKNIEVDLSSKTMSAVFPDPTTLPARLNTNALHGSSFLFGVFVPPAGPGQASPQVELIIANGTITSIDFASIAEVAPEPGTLTSAALGISALALGTALRRRAAMSAKQH
jgi:hypothetical protein